MSCDFKHCDPLEPGGCPCAEVKRCGGPMTQKQTAEALGISHKELRSIEQLAMYRLRKQEPVRIARLRKLWGEAWPESPMSWLATASERFGNEGLDPRPLYRQLVKKFRELGWDRDKFNVAFGDES